MTATQVKDRTLAELLDQIAARVPAPGGGVTAALHGAQAAALLAMVARYTTGDRFATHAVTVTRLIEDSDVLRQQCLELATDDEGAFSAVSAAYRLPTGSDSQKQARSDAIAGALVEAASPPTAVIGRAQLLVAIAEVLLPICNKTVITDVGAAADATRAAATTARLNVEINLGGITDTAVREQLVGALSSVEDVIKRADRISEVVRAQLA